MLTLLAGGSGAHAQSLARSAQPLWAVLDFENHTGYGGPEVGREASDAFVVELGKSNKYDVLSRQETQQGLANTGQTEPLDTIGLQRLGRTLQSDAVATGEVAAISFSKNPRQATASVIIRVTDTNTGELVNGALAQGTSNPRTVNTGDDDALVNEAINNAAFAAVRQIVQFNLPKATVLNNEDQDHVLLNKGTRDGLYTGLEMVVTRSGNEVGRIRVAGTAQDQSDAVVTRRGLGIQPQDHATAIYQLPSYSVQGNVLHAGATDVSSDGGGGSHSHSGFSGVTGLLVAILAGALLLSLIHRGNSQGSIGGAQIGKPVAVENRQDVIGGTGTKPGINPVTQAADGLVPVPPDPFTPISVRITATTGNISAQNFIEYHVYRSDFPAVLNSTNAVNGTVIANFGQVPLLTYSGQGGMQVYDDGGDKVGVVVQKPDAARTGLTAYSVTAVIPGTGIAHVGDRFQYFIEGLYIQPAANGGSGQNPGQPGGGGTLGTTLYQLTGRTPTNFVTYIEPVLLQQGDATSGVGGSFASSTSPDNTIVSVPSTRSANDYVLELATDPGFGSKTRLTPDSSGPYVAAVATPRSGNPVIWYLQTGSRNESLRERFPNASALYARIGCRDTRNGSSEGTNPYIYSDPVGVPSALVPNSGVSGPPSAPSSRRHK